jgi:hypothetical protein
MKSIELVYWLQGFFELIELTPPPKEKETILNKEHYQCIQNHINLVKTFEKEKALPFIHWLEGFISGYLVSLSTEDSVSGYAQAVNTTKEIKTRLNDLFEHTIDPSYGKDQSALNQAHRPRPPHGLLRPDSDRRVRC